MSDGIVQTLIIAANGMHTSNPMLIGRVIGSEWRGRCLEWALGEVSPELVESVRGRIEGHRLGRSLGCTDGAIIIAGAYPAGGSVENDDPHGVAIAEVTMPDQADLLLLVDPPLGGGQSGRESGRESGGAQRDPAAVAVGAVRRALREMGVGYLQATSETWREESRLERVGFCRVANVAVMSLELDGAQDRAHERVHIDRPPPADHRWVTLEQLGAGWRSAVIATVEATFEGSQDSLGLVGYREAFAVAAGLADGSGLDHRLSRLLRVGGDWAGVLLIAPLGGVSAGRDGDLGDRAGGSVEGPDLELRYLGITPRLRGSGWGVTIVTELLRVARGDGARRIGVSVDLASGAAVAIYRRFGWREVVRRGVWGCRTEG